MRGPRGGGGPAQYVREAVETLQVERIDHGCRVLEDPELTSELARRATPFTVCPLSNVRLRVVDSMEEHPLRKMLDAGLNITLHSDDPAFFGGYGRELPSGAGPRIDDCTPKLLPGLISDGKKAELLAEVDAHMRAR